MTLYSCRDCGALSTGNYCPQCRGPMTVARRSALRIAVAVDRSYRARMLELSSRFLGLQSIIYAGIWLGMALIEWGP